MTMTKEQVAELLDGREYGNEVTGDINIIAKNSGLVIMFGQSDDLMQFRGAIHDEVGCWGGGIVYFGESGLAQSECDDDDCPYFINTLDDRRSVVVEWPWKLTTSMPHVKFNIYEDGELYGEGIVFELASLKG